MTIKMIMEKENSVATISSCSVSNEGNNNYCLSAIDSSEDLFSNPLPIFDRTGMKLGRVLGQGSFCSVSKLCSHTNIIKSIQNHDDISSEFSHPPNSRIPIHMQDHNDEDSTSRRRSHNNKKYYQKTESRKFSINFFSQTRSQSNTDHYYVLKQVRPDLEFLQPMTYKQAFEDLEFESKLLSSLNHPNIISIHGVSQLGASDFIVLERLEKTLPQQIKEWRKLERKAQSKSILPFLPAVSSVGSGWASFSNGCNNNGIRKSCSIRRLLNESYEDRIGVALDLANVLEYLHKNNLVYRDLKPTNIGFDATGTLKLFDFGMARRLVLNDLADDGINYHITGLTGTLRYMAPEVGLDLPYNASADIYSWSMIFWYLLSLKVPYEKDCKPEYIFEQVFKKGVRPVVSESWSESVTGLLERAWDTDSSIRPSPSEICSVLSFELVDCVSNSYATDVSITATPTYLTVVAPYQDTALSTEAATGYEQQVCDDYFQPEQSSFEGIVSRVADHADTIECSVPTIARACCSSTNFTLPQDHRIITAKTA